MEVVELYNGRMSKRPKAEGRVPQSEVEQIAYRLRISRMAQNLKPSEVCRLAKIAPNTYSQWEGAAGRPNLEGAKLLRRHLGYTLDWIYEGDLSGLPFALATKIAEFMEKEPKPATPPRGKPKAA